MEKVMYEMSPDIADHPADRSQQVKKQAIQVRDQVIGVTGEEPVDYLLMESLQDGRTYLRKFIFIMFCSDNILKAARGICVFTRLPP